jgi:hypothetical protein
MKARGSFVLPVLVLGTILCNAQTPYPAFGTGPTGGGIVKDAPYSAEVISTYDTVLPGGKQLHGETHGRVFRDSEGRTRSESDAVSSTATATKSKLIFINDPVDHSVIMLDPQTMTARVNTWPFPVGSSTAIKLQPAPLPPAGDLDSSSQPSAAGGKFYAAAPGAPGAAAGVFSGAQTEDLGTRQMEGVTVTGTRVTRTLSPAPSETQPRTMVMTTWVSTDLKITVSSETEDAQAGHRATKLVNIVRTEPGAALFQIPSGYTVADSRAPK